MLRIIYVTMLVSAALAPSIGLAGDADVSPALRAKAEALCKGDAERLCPDSLTDQNAILTCMQPKRALLKSPCKQVFDEVVRDVQK